MLNTRNNISLRYENNSDDKNFGNSDINRLYRGDIGEEKGIYEINSGISWII